MTPHIGGLLRHATEDLEHAEENLHAFPKHAGFSLQQAAEKIMKAVLETEGINYPGNTHQLDVLVGSLPADHLWRGDFLDFIFLTSQATQTRYPTASGRTTPPLPRAKLEETLAQLKAVLPEVKDWCEER